MNAGHAIFVHNDHRLGFMSCDQIVEDKILVTLVAPSCFVLAISVLRVQDRIAQGSLVVAGRCVNENPSCLASCFFAFYVFAFTDG